MNKFDIKLPEGIDESIDRGIKMAVRDKCKKKSSRIKKVFGGIAVGVIITSGIGISNPALARKIPIIGGLFEIVQDKAEFKGDYTSYVQKVGKSVTSNGVTVTLDEYVCDGKSIYTTYKVVSETPFKYIRYNYDPVIDKKITKEEADKLIGTDLKDKSTTKLSFSNEVSNGNGKGRLVGRYMDENTFIGVQKYDLRNLKNIPDNFEFENNITELTSLSWRMGEPDQVFKGKWNFKIPVKVDKSAVKEIKVNEEKEGLGLKKITVTEFEIIVDYINKYGLKASPENSLWVRVKDEKGNELDSTTIGDKEVIIKRNGKSPKMIVFEIYKQKSINDNKEIEEKVLYTKQVNIK